MIHNCWSEQRELRLDARTVFNQLSLSSTQETAEVQRGDQFASQTVTMIEAIYFFQRFKPQRQVQTPSRIPLPPVPLPPLSRIWPGSGYPFSWKVASTAVDNSSILIATILFPPL